VFRTAKGSRVEPEPAPAKDEKPADASVPPHEGGEPAAEEKPVAVEAADDATKPTEARKPGAPLPEGTALLERIRPLMRRNRRGPGGSGSTSFLSRALRTNETELMAAFVGLGLVMPATPGDKPVLTEFGNELWWLNVDSRGGVWINGREKRPGETITAAGESVPAPAAQAEVPPVGEGEQATPAAAPTGVASDGGEAAAPPAPAASSSEPAPAAPAPVASTTDAALTAPGSASPPTSEAVVAAAPPAAAAATATPASPAALPVGAPGVPPLDTSSPLTALRLLLKETRTGGFAGKMDRLAEEIGKSADEIVARLVGAGLKVPEKAREKPVFVEHAGEIFWFNRNARGELWLNAKASKFADKPEVESAEGEAEENDTDKSASESEGDDGDAEKKEARRGSRARSKKLE
jgi:hypothetical protein